MAQQQTKKPFDITWRDASFALTAAVVMAFPASSQKSEEKDRYLGEAFVELANDKGVAVSAIRRDFDTFEIAQHNRFQEKKPHSLYAKDFERIERESPAKPATTFAFMAVAGLLAGAVLSKLSRSTQTINLPATDRLSGMQTDLA